MFSPKLTTCLGELAAAAEGRQIANGASTAAATTIILRNLLARIVRSLPISRTSIYPLPIPASFVSHSVDLAGKNPFHHGKPPICTSTPNEQNGCSSNGRPLIVTIAVYLIAAALVVCGCLFFIMRARSRD
jgi:hypothetical protein